MLVPTWVRPKAEQPMRGRRVLPSSLAKADNVPQRTRAQRMTELRAGHPTAPAIVAAGHNSSSKGAHGRSTRSNH